MGKIFITPEMVRDCGIEFQEISHILKSAVDKYTKCMERNVYIAQEPVFFEDNQKMQIAFHNINKSIEAIDEYANRCIQMSELALTPDENFRNIIFFE